MSTRASIHFVFDGRPNVLRANIYRHSDGHPDGDYGMLADLDKFFKAVEEQCGHDTRFDDPEYLAAKFVVWQAHENAGETPLAFLSVGVQIDDPGDIEYRYRVACVPRGSGRPKVTWEEV